MINEGHKFKKYLHGIIDAVLRAGRPTGLDDPHGGVEPRDIAKARQRSMADGGAMAYLRARPVDRPHTIPPA